MYRTPRINSTSWLRKWGRSSYRRKCTFKKCICPMVRCKTIWTSRSTIALKITVSLTFHRIKILINMMSTQKPNCCKKSNNCPPSNTTLSRYVQSVWTSLWKVCRWSCFRVGTCSTTTASTTGWWRSPSVRRAGTKSCELTLNFKSIVAAEAGPAGL